jgi:hypothetical protein
MFVGTGAVMTDKSELLPCPFCGGDDIDGNDEVVRCRKCGAEQPYLSLDHDATERWNTRADLSRPPADQMPDMVEREIARQVELFYDVGLRVTEVAKAFARDVAAALQASTGEE